MQVTKHAKERMKERCGLNDKSSERLAKIAYEKGLRHRDLTGNLKKWVDKQYFYNRRANDSALWGQGIHIP